MFKRGKKGFTLIELIVVITILGVLVLIATPKFLDYVGKATEVQVKNDIRAYESSIGAEMIKDPDFIAKQNWGTISSSELQGNKDNNEVFNKEGILKNNFVLANEYYKVENYKNVKSKLKGDFLVDDNGNVLYHGTDVKVTDDGNENDNSQNPGESDGSQNPEVKTYTVTFLDPDENLIETQQVEHGKAATAPTPPAISGKEFTGWDKTFNNVVTHLFVKAIYKDSIQWATDSDFQWVSDVNENAYTAVGQTGTGYYNYVGNKEVVAIPHVIKGNPVTSYYRMFYNTGKTVKKVISTNTEITNMNSMFNSSLAETPLDLSNLYTSKVTNMGNMFNSSKATSLDLSNFDTSKVTNMDIMFMGSKVTSLDLSSFDTSEVTAMNYMFYGLPVTEVYVRTPEDASKFDESPGKPSGLNFEVKQ